MSKDAIIYLKKNPLKYIKSSQGQLNALYIMRENDRYGLRIKTNTSDNLETLESK